VSGAADAATVRVWRIALDPLRAPDAAALAELSEEERARASRFATDALRNRWLHGHVATRRIIARELGVAPAAIRYGAESAGKPFVAAPARSGLEFSFSDSGDLALLAVGRGCALGADVEWRRPLSDLAGVAERFFAAEECAALFALPEAAREAGFYRLWTRKEAYIKALGTGLGHALAKFVVTIAIGDARLVSVDGDRAAAAQCALRSIDVGADHEGALVALRPDIVITVSDWPAR
jgi:4'-phosphopantetheinyl transferase